MKALIVGGGIGGLTTALFLNNLGIEVKIFERADEIYELGVGINMLPNAVKELASLGLLDALDAQGIRTHELVYANRFGQVVWQELRGVDAGHAFPQFSIHRGAIQAILDARSLAMQLASSDRLQTALAAYDAERRTTTSKIVLSNREGGPEGVIDMVEARAPDGFDNIDSVATRKERQAVVGGYALIAGFAEPPHDA